MILKICAETDFSGQREEVMLPRAARKGYFSLREEILYTHESNDMSQEHYIT